MAKKVKRKKGKSLVKIGNKIENLLDKLQGLKSELDEYEGNDIAIEKFDFKLFEAGIKVLSVANEVLISD